ncbi:MAG: S-layer homology domain-containing protein [Clostridia bacterium]|nr:S-layer homology domain-containing protein [Clostridia bacterium]
MKRIFSALLVICMIFSVMASATAQVFAVDVSSPKNIFYAKYIGENADGEYEGETPVIDGVINPNEWIESDFQAWPKEAGNDIAFYYDEENIYIATRMLNEEINIPYYPNGYHRTADRFLLWIDPYDEDKEPSPVANYFMEFHTEYVELNQYGNYNTHHYIAGSLGPSIAPGLNYYDVECKANTDDIFNKLYEELGAKGLKELITFENDEPWGFEVPNGVWEVEYKIPFGLINILDVENDVIRTDTEDWGTYIAFSGWRLETKDVCKEHTITLPNYSDTIHHTSEYVAGRNRRSFDYAACYFSDARPGEKPANPNSKALGDINPSGEIERSMEEADGWAKEKISSKITVNGKLDEAAWNLSKTPIQNPSNEFDSYYDVQWDDKYLYIAVDTGDTSVSTPETLNFDQLNELPIAEFDNIRIDIDPNSSRDGLELSERAISIHLPRAAQGEEEYKIGAANGRNWNGSDFIKGLAFNYDMKVRYTNALTEGESWKAEIAIPWEMFNKTPNAIFPTTTPELLIGDDVEINISYMNSIRAKEILYNEVVSGEEIVIVTEENTIIAPAYNTVAPVAQPYTYKFLRMVEDEGEFSKEVDGYTVTFKVDDKFLDQNTYGLVYRFDATNPEQYFANVEIPVSSLNRQNYRSYYIDFINGIQIEIPSGLLTNNLIKGDKSISLDDKVVFSINKCEAFLEPHVTVDITINGKPIYPETPFKLTYPLDINAPTTEYEAKGLELRDADGQVYPLTNVKFVDKYSVEKDPYTGEEFKTCTDRKYIVKTTLSGTYGMAIYETSANDIEGWFKPYVEKVMKYGLMKGYDEGGIKFKPNQNISRAEVATLVMRLTQKSVEIPENGEKFVDVKNNDWFNTIVYRAKELGFVNGVGNGKFDPNAPITRGDFFTLIERALTKMDIDFKDSDHALFSQTFGKTDYNMFSENRGGRYAYAYAGAVFCFSNGIVVGNEEAPGQFWMRPERAITRAEIATLVAKLMDNFIVPQANK